MSFTFGKFVDDHFGKNKPEKLGNAEELNAQKEKLNTMNELLEEQLYQLQKKQKKIIKSIKENNILLENIENKISKNNEKELNILNKLKSKPRRRTFKEAEESIRRNMEKLELTEAEKNIVISELARFFK